MFVNVRGRVLEVAGSIDKEGAPLGVGARTSGANQRFEILFADKEPALKTEGLHADFGFHIGRPFYIVTKMGSGRALEVDGGSNVVLRWKKRGEISQQFYFDNGTKTIKSQRYQDKSLDIQDAGKSSNLQIWKSNGRWFQMFRLKGEYIVNEQGKVLDVAGGEDKEEANVIVWKSHGGRNQQWKIVYVDEDKPEPKKGELNEEFGMYVEREFYIETELSSHRYLDLIGNNVVLKTPNGFDSQKWFFEQKTKTIRSVSADRSLDIQGAGKAANLQVWNTNSGWW
jgi:hypothetical protein